MQSQLFPVLFRIHFPRCSAFRLLPSDLFPCSLVPGPRPFPLSPLGKVNVELFKNKICQRFFYLTMPGNRALTTIAGININIMLAAVPFHVASCLDKLLYQLVSLQTATSISMVLDSGCGGISTSAITMR